MKEENKKKTGILLQSINDINFSGFYVWYESTIKTVYDHCVAINMLN